MPGTLYIVATPMGNLEDISFRAVRILKEADLIAAEDTRHSRKLLSHYQIATPTTPCHEHNEIQRIEDLISRLSQGRTIALISDAGTPLISDPGFKLVQAAADAEIPVVPIPGCNAAITGLSAAGLPTDSFLFIGFLPKKQGKQSQVLTCLVSQSATLVFYESPKRVVSLVKNSLNILGDRQACLARELTKRYEEFLRGSLSEILADLEARSSIKGECVLMIQGEDSKKSALSPDKLDEIILEQLAGSPKTGVLAKALAKEHNLPKKQVYDAILRLKG